MRRAVTVLVALTLASSAWAQNLVSNGDFSATLDGRSGLLEAWMLPEAGWERAPDAGPDGAAALRIEVREGRAEPAWQHLDYARPGASYRLTLVARSEGVVRPLVRVLNRDTGEEIAQVVMEAGATWRERSVSFETQTANLTLQLWPDPGHIEGPGPTGTVEFASVSVAAVEGLGERPGPDLDNIALNRPYEVRPSTYSLCAHPDDMTVHLTDGEYTEGYFWTQPATVGWRSSGPEFITIDLGEVHPIAGVSYSTAAGVAGVEWPTSIRIFVSEDGEQWHPAGDLVRMHTRREPLPPMGDYATEFIWTDELATRGRFVTLAVSTNGGYIFVDEVEIYRGDEELLEQRFTSEPVPDVMDYVQSQPIFDLHRRHLAGVREEIADLPAGARADLARRADALDDAIDTMPPVAVGHFRAILPMTATHEQIFKLQADVWLARGRDRIRLWQNNRWDPLGPGEEPTSDATPLVSVEMMRNETRADVLNITSANPRSMRARLSIRGMPGGVSPDWITVRQVEHVGSRFIPTVASPLPVADRDGDAWMIEVPAGMTRQVWFEIDSSGLESGTWEGSVEIASVAGGRQSVPLQVTVHPLTMPDEKTLRVGGWSYTDGTTHRGLTPENTDLLIEHLRERGVNTPWGLSATLPAGSFDAEGVMVTEPDTARFDRWVAKWPGSTMYLVFASVGQRFAGATMGTELFDRQVGQWAEFWSGHMTELGLRPDQLGVLLVDEPRSAEQYETIAAWARAIKAGAPEMVIWEDPFHIDDTELMREVLALTDIICPMRRHYIGDRDWQEIIREEKDRGTELWFYSCSGPARAFGPYEYYLAQAWHAYSIGAIGSQFWAFADTGGTNSWNDYTASRAGSYSPVYLDDTSVTAAKPMEAIRESQQDFEYLVMLASLVDERAAAGAADAQLAAARRLLANGPARVIGDNPEAYRWDVESDRTIQDRVRREILQELLALEGR